MRIVSLLPSTTEIICLLGLENCLVGRSHECDYPHSIRSLPACTAPKYQADGTSYEIDQLVEAIVQDGLSVYRVDAGLLKSLKPDLILTQDHCEVCAVSYSEVEKTVTEHLAQPVEIVSVSPTDLDGVFLSIQQIAEATNAIQQGDVLVKEMVDRLNRIHSKTGSLPSPDVVCIEWMDPLMTAGNWMPELAEIAGGNCRASTAGEHSPKVKWHNILEADPDIILLVPCGYDIKQTADEIDTLTEREGWEQLAAVQNSRVFICDGNQYFNRPGPRLADSAYILAEIFHPGIFENRYQNTGWIKLSEL